MMSRKADRSSKRNTQHVAETDRGDKRTREGAKSGMGRLERMIHGSGIKGRDDTSSRI